jgi:hypothetical protein
VILVFFYTINRQDSSKKFNIANDFNHFENFHWGRAAQTDISRKTKVQAATTFLTSPPIVSKKADNFSAGMKE